MEHTVKISINELVELLEFRLLAYGYTTFDERTHITFESDENSYFGKHVIIFDKEACYCDGLSYVIGTSRNHKTDETAIKKFIDNIITNILD